MAKHHHNKKQASKGQSSPNDRRQDSVFREAWENMNEDMARIMPAFLTGRKGKLWTMLIVTLLELVVLGVVGKLVYDWFAGN